MLTIDFLPVKHGDALWLEWGDEAAPRRMLVDGGPPGTFDVLEARIAVLPAGARHIDLLVVSHVDTDHICGVLELLRRAGELGVSIGEVWFNGFHHLRNGQTPPYDTLGGREGEALTQLIVELQLPWNRAFARRAAKLGRSGAPRRLRRGGLEITLLSPTEDKLLALEPEWEEACRRAGILPGAALAALEEEAPPEDLLGGDDVEALAQAPFQRDRTTPNGSSIAFIATFDGKSILFAADAHADVLVPGLEHPAVRALLARAPLAAVKMSHHGSRANSSLELMRLAPARHYLFSSNGGANTKHPHPEAVARSLVANADADKTLWFTYRTDFNDAWDSPARQRRWGYRTRYGDGTAPLRITL